MIKTKGTVAFLGIGEQLNKPSLNPVEFDGIKMWAGLGHFTLAPIDAYFLHGSVSPKFDSEEGNSLEFEGIRNETALDQIVNGDLERMGFSWK